MTISRDRKAVIKSMALAGKSQGEIAKVTKLSNSTVSRHLKLIPGFSYKSRSGNKMILSCRDERMLARMYNQGTITRLWEGVEYAETRLGKKISTTTVKSALKKQGLRCHNSPMKPDLTAENKKERLKFAKQYKDWTAENWRSVVFTDETSCYTYGPRLHFTHFRSDDVPLQTGHMVPSAHFGGLKQSMWAGMTYDGLLKCVLYDGSLNSVKYIEVLNESLKDFMSRHKNFKIVQDNASYHTSVETIAWFSERDFKLVSIPPNSPDLNPIENLWGSFKRKLYSSDLRHMNRTQFKQHIKREWNRIPGSYYEGLVDSMHDRIKAVIKAKGGNTKY